MHLAAVQQKMGEGWQLAVSGVRCQRVSETLLEEGSQALDDHLGGLPGETELAGDALDAGPLLFGYPQIGVRWRLIARGCRTELCREADEARTVIQANGAEGVRLQTRCG